MAVFDTAERREGAASDTFLRCASGAEILLASRADRARNTPVIGDQGGEVCQDTRTSPTYVWLEPTVGRSGHPLLASCIGPATSPSPTRQSASVVRARVPSLPPSYRTESSSRLGFRLPR